MRQRIQRNFIRLFRFGCGSLISWWSKPGAVQAGERGNLQRGDCGEAVFIPEAVYHYQVKGREKGTDRRTEGRVSGEVEQSALKSILS